MTFRTTLILPLTTAALCAAGLALAGPPSGDHPGPGSFLERHDLNADGTVTAEEFGRSNPIFRELDADGNGAVDTAEMDARREQMALRAVGHLARRADADDDDAVTAGEWSAWLAEVDADGDGILALEELAPRCGDGPCGRSDRGRGPGPGSDPSDEAAASRAPGADAAAGPRHRRGFRPGPGRILDVVDPDDDGQLRVAELDAYFGRLDADGDGRLADGELPERRRPGHGRRGPGRRGFGPRG